MNLFRNLVKNSNTSKARKRLPSNLFSDTCSQRFCRVCQRISRWFALIYWLILNDDLILPNKAQVDNDDNDDDGYDYTGNETSISISLAGHLLLKLFICHPNIVDRTSHLFIDFFQFRPLKHCLVFYVLGQRGNISHHLSHHSNCFVPILD